MVEHLPSKQDMGVRFSLPAQKDSLLDKNLWISLCILCIKDRMIKNRMALNKDILMDIGHFV